MWENQKAPHPYLPPRVETSELLKTIKHRRDLFLIFTFFKKKKEKTRILWTGSFRRISKGTIIPQILRVKAQACCITKKCWRAFFVCCYGIKTEYASLCRDVTYPHIANIFLGGNPKRKKEKKKKTLVWSLVLGVPGPGVPSTGPRWSWWMMLWLGGWLVGLSEGVSLSGSWLLVGWSVGWLGAVRTTLISSMAVPEHPPISGATAEGGSVEASGCSCPKWYSSLPPAGGSTEGRKPSRTCSHVRVFLVFFVLTNK